MRKVIAGFLAFLFILGFAVQVAGRAGVETIFSPDPYIAIVRQPEFADAVVKIARKEVAAQVTQSGDFGTLVTEEDVELVAEQLITGPWLAQQLEEWLGAFFDYLKSGEKEPRFVLSLVELKRQAPALLESLLVEKAKSLPVCRSEIVWEMIEALLQQREMPPCIPAGVDVEAIVKSNIVDLDGMLAGALKSVPDQVDVLELMEQDPQSKQNFMQAIQSVRDGRLKATWWLNLLAVVLILLLLVIGLLRSRPRRALLQWWGWPMLLGGGLALGAFAVLRFVAMFMWQQAISSPDTELPAEIFPVLRSAMDSFLSTIWGQVLVIGGIAALVGLALILFSLALPKGQKAQA